MRVAMYTRGHGFGHAARDLPIVRALRAQGATVDVASSSLGADFYALNDQECRRLPVDDDDDHGPAAIDVLASDAAARALPDVYVVDEFLFLPAVLRASSTTPVVLVTDWFFTERGLPSADAMLLAADRIVVPDFEEVHRPLALLRDRTVFTGPIAKAPAPPATGVAPTPGRGEAGRRLVVTVGGLLGSELSRGILQNLVPALAAWCEEGDQVTVLAPEPEDPSLHLPGFRWVGMQADPWPLYRSADVVICDAYGTLLGDLAADGVRTLAVLPIERPDPVSVLRVKVIATAAGGSVRVLRLGADERAIHDEISALLARTSPEPEPALLRARFADPGMVAAHIGATARGDG